MYISDLVTGACCVNSLSALCVNTSLCFKKPQDCIMLFFCFRLPAGACIGSSLRIIVSPGCCFMFSCFVYRLPLLCESNVSGCSFLLSLPHDVFCLVTSSDSDSCINRRRLHVHCINTIFLELKYINKLPTGKIYLLPSCPNTIEY